VSTAAVAASATPAGLPPQRQAAEPDDAAGPQQQGRRLRHDRRRRLGSDIDAHAEAQRVRVQPLREVAPLP